MSGPLGRRSWRKSANDFLWLLRGEMYVMRLQWFWYLIFMAFSPILFMLLLWLFGGRGNPTATLYVITGSLAQGLTSTSMLTLGQQIGGRKDQHAYEHFAMLPISKVAFLLAMATRSMLFGLPSFVIILGFGTLVFGLPLAPSPLLVPVVLLAAYSMAALGAFVGFFSKTGQVASLATQVLSGVMVTFAPVYLRPDQLPPLLRVTGAVIPVTYVADALRGTLTGALGRAVWTDVGILAAFTLVSLWLVVNKLDWRAGQE